MGGLRDVESAGVHEELDALLNDFCLKPESIVSIKNAIDLDGLVGPNVMKAIGDEQRKLNFSKPGLYKELFKLDKKMPNRPSTRAAAPAKSVATGSVPLKSVTKTKARRITPDDLFILRVCDSGEAMTLEEMRAKCECDSSKMSAILRWVTGSTEGRSKYVVTQQGDKKLVTSNGTWRDDHLKKSGLKSPTEA